MHNSVGPLEVGEVHSRWVDITACELDLGQVYPSHCPGLPPALGEPGPPHRQAPSLAQPQVGSPQPVPQDPKLLAPGGQGAEGAPRGQGKAMASAHCKECLHSFLPWLLRPGQTGKRQPLPPGRSTMTGRGGGSN